MMGDEMERTWLKENEEPHEYGVYYSGCRRYKIEPYFAHGLVFYQFKSIRGDVCVFDSLKEAKSEGPKVSFG